MDILQTKLGQNFKKQAAKISSELEEMAILDNGGLIRKREPAPIYSIDPSNTHTPPWDYVLRVPKDEGYIYVVDNRSFETHLRVTKPVEANANLSRAITTFIWNDRPERFSSVLPQLCLAYSAWMKGLVRANYYTLEDIDIEVYGVAFSFYMFTMVRFQGGEVSDLTRHVDDFLVFARNRLRTPDIVLTKIFPADLRGSLEERLEDLGGAIAGGYFYDSILTYVRIVLDNPAAMLDVSSLLNSAEKSWQGANSVMLSMFAVEHPAIFGNLLSTAITNRIYSRTRIGHAAEVLRHNRLDPTTLPSSLLGA